MSKYQEFISLPNEEIAHRIKQYGSVMGVMRASGFSRGDNRIRLYLLDFINRHSLEQDATQYLNNRRQYTVEDVRIAVAASMNMAQVLVALGIQDHGANRKTIQKTIVQHNISVNHFRSQGVRRAFEYTRDEIFCENSKYSRSSLSKAAKRYKILPYQCVGGCGNNGTWLGKPLNLVIDHINGVSNDNRVDNLRYLCYNCHSITDTFAGKNNKRRRSTNLT